MSSGRCEDCQGAGLKTIEMQFLSDVQIPCDTCRGKRFNLETLQILYKNKTTKDIAEASDQLNISSLSTPVTKYFICYPKLLKI